MKTDLEPPNDDRSPTDDRGFGRRDFIKMGLASAALCAGLISSRAFAQAATSPGAKPTTYKPATSNYMQDTVAADVSAYREQWRDEFGRLGDQIRAKLQKSNGATQVSKCTFRSVRGWMLHAELVGRLIVALMAAIPAMAHEATPASTVLITNANIFDGENEQLATGMSVLVEGNRIAKIAKSIPAPAGATLIDAKGKVLMPGLTDAHWHSMFNFWPISKVMGADFGLLSIAASKAARETLMRGFTTVRDVGGNSFPISRGVDSGLIDGPRIYPSGGYIGQTSGHGDFRGPNDVPENPGTPLDYMQRVGHTLIADGVPEVIKRSREVLRMGATQVKVMAGGGVSSLYDPLDVTEYTFDEMKAVVEVAKTWNTYVAIHANTDDAIRLWVEAGAKSVEHGFFISEETAKLMAKKGVWWSMQPMEAEGEDAFKFESPISTAKYEECVAGLDKVVSLAKKHHVQIAFGTDLLFDAKLAAKQGRFLAKLKKWFTPYEALKIATHDNAELFKLSGPRDPYPGKLGVVEEGAYADLLLVDGNPLQNLDLVADPHKNFVVIMKDGVIYKNTLR